MKITKSILPFSHAQSQILEPFAMTPDGFARRLKVDLKVGLRVRESREANGSEDRLISGRTPRGAGGRRVMSHLTATKGLRVNP